MWPSQCSLHSGEPNFKASLYPSTNCGQAAKVPVDEKLFTGLFSMSTLSLRNTAKKQPFLSEQVAF